MAHVTYNGNFAPLTASPAATGNGTTVTLPAGAEGFLISVSTQTAYMTLDGSVPSATNGLTLPAGTVQFVPATTSKGVTVLAGTAGAVVNILPLG